MTRETDLKWKAHRGDRAWPGSRTFRRRQAFGHLDGLRRRTNHPTHTETETQQIVLRP